MKCPHDDLEALPLELYRPGLVQGERKPEELCGGEFARRLREDVERDTRRDRGDVMEPEGGHGKGIARLQQYADGRWQRGGQGMPTQVGVSDAEL